MKLREGPPARGWRPLPVGTRLTLAMPHQARIKPVRRLTIARTVALWWVWLALAAWGLVLAGMLRAVLRGGPYAG